MPSLEAFFGLTCPVCGGELDAPGVCTACRERIVPARRGGGVYLGRYRALAGLVRAVKYREHRLALTWAAERLAARVAATPWPLEAVVFVPTFPWRALSRGVYAPRVLAEEIAKRLGLPLLPALVRVRYTASQTRRRERRKLPQVFLATRRVPRVVLLADDVFTSGATFFRAAEALAARGAEEVYGAFLAVADPKGLAALPYNPSHQR